MRRWGIVGLIGVSAFVAPIATAAPAHAVCISLFRTCPPTGTPPTTAPPVTTPPVTTPPPPVAPPPAPPPPVTLDPNQAAEQFFDAANAARAGSGLPPLAWRTDVAAMAVSQSVAMAQAGDIFHGSFVSSGNLHALGASSLGENVGMGQAVGQVHDAFMNSQHHRENILDSGFNQVGIGVIVTDGGLFVTEDFLQAKGGPVSARPTAVAHPAVKAPAPKATNRVASAPKKVSAPSAATPATSAPTTAAPAPAPEPTGVVNALPFDSSPAAASPAQLVPRAVGSHGVTAAAALFGALVLAGAAAGHVVVRRRRA